MTILSKILGTPNQILSNGVFKVDIILNNTTNI